MAGYSGKSLIDRLGYQPGDVVFIHNTPLCFTAALTDAGIIISSTLPTTWAHLFFKTQKDLRQTLKSFDLDKVQKALWVSWPKRASKVPTDITEQTLRDVILPLGWVDVKVVAVDETWSGLKFTQRNK